LIGCFPTSSLEPMSRPSDGGGLRPQPRWNPRFVEELVAMLTERDELIGEDHPGGSADTAELEVPPTIEALMAARIDQLPAEEREVLERGSVIGMQFGAGEVSRLG